MKVHTLIRLLSKYPQNAEVDVQAYQGRWYSDEGIPYKREITVKERAGKVTVSLYARG